MRLSEEEAVRLGILPKKTKKSKYRSNKVWNDGIAFDSQKEADFYCELKIKLRAGLITGFCRQARFVVIEGENGNRGT